MRFYQIDPLSSSRILRLIQGRPKDYPARMNAIILMSLFALPANEPNLPPPLKGQVLILDNDRTLEGEIDKVGDRYRLRRGQAITWVPAQSSAVLCADLPEALATLRKRANMQDPDERLRLAHWCLARNLRDEGIHEAKAALQLRPDHGTTQRLVKHLETRDNTTPVAKTAPSGDEPGASPVQLTTDTLSFYNHRIQPILMNACASCHAADRGGNFRLTRSYGAGMGNRKALQANIAAVVAYVSPTSPLSSPLLVKSVSIHGGQSQPALKGRQSEPYKQLEDWVRLVAEEYAVTRPTEPGLLPVGFAAETKKPIVRPLAPEIQQADVKTVESRPGESKFAEAKQNPVVPAATPATPMPMPDSSTKPVPTPMPKTADPYDPEPFNQLPAKAP